jgi:hypothetical protein
LALPDRGASVIVKRSLSEVAADSKRGDATPQELFDTFVAARLYWPAPTTPGVPVIRIGEELVAPLFSSEEELVKFVGRGKWLSATGLEVLTIVPAGVTIGLDLSSDHRLQLDPAAARVEYDLVLRQRGAATSNGGAGGAEGEV